MGPGVGCADRRTRHVLHSPGSHRPKASWAMHTPTHSPMPARVATPGRAFARKFERVFCPTRVDYKLASNGQAEGIAREPMA